MNRTELLFSAIGQVGDDLIARADAPVRRTRPWVRAAALAACLALVLGLGIYALPKLHTGNAQSAAPDLSAAAPQTTEAACASDGARPETPAEQKAEAIPEPEEAPAEAAPSQPEAEMEETVREDMKNTADLAPAGLSLVIDARGVTPEGCAYTVENRLSDSVRFCPGVFLLEQLTDDGWQELPVQAESTAEPEQIPAQTVYDAWADFTRFGTLAPGTYRMTVRVTVAGEAAQTLSPTAVFEIPAP